MAETPTPSYLLVIVVAVIIIIAGGGASAYLYLHNRPTSAPSWVDFERRVHGFHVEAAIRQPRMAAGARGTRAHGGDSGGRQNN